MSADPNSLPQAVPVQLTSIWQFLILGFMVTTATLQIASIGVLFWLGYRIRKFRYFKETDKFL